MSAGKGNKSGVRKRPGSDPILAAIKAARSAFSASIRAYTVMDNAIAGARDKHGEPPRKLIGWRNFGAIGADEIEGAYNDFLATAKSNAGRTQLGREYRNAKARYAQAVAACGEWDRKAGIRPLRVANERAREAYKRAHSALAQTRPTTPAGAAALIRYLRRDMKIGDAPWQLPALATLAKALIAMSGRARA